MILNGYRPSPPYEIVAVFHRHMALKQKDQIRRRTYSPLFLDDLESDTVSEASLCQFSTDDEEDREITEFDYMGYSSEDEYEQYYPKDRLSKKDKKTKKIYKKEKNIGSVTIIPHVNGIINKKMNWKSDYLKKVQQNLSLFVYTKEEQKKQKKIISKKIKRKNKNFNYVLRDNLLTKESKELDELDQDWLEYLEELYDKNNYEDDYWYC